MRISLRIASYLHVAALVGAQVNMTHASDAADRARRESDRQSAAREQQRQADQRQADQRRASALEQQRQSERRHAEQRQADQQRATVLEQQRQADQREATARAQQLYETNKSSLRVDELSRSVPNPTISKNAPLMPATRTEPKADFPIPSAWVWSDGESLSFRRDGTFESIHLKNRLVASEVGQYKQIANRLKLQSSEYENN